MKAVALALMLAAGLAAAGAANSRDDAVVKWFRLPSKNIACEYRSSGPAGLRCDIYSKLKPTPKGRCLDAVWSAMWLPPAGKARPECISDSIYRPSPVLAYGQTWRAGGFTCKSAVSGLTCTNRIGRGFFLSRQSWRTF